MTVFLVVAQLSFFECKRVICECCSTTAKCLLAVSSVDMSRLYLPELFKLASSLDVVVQIECDFRSQQSLSTKVTCKNSN